MVVKNNQCQKSKYNEWLHQQSLAALFSLLQLPIAAVQSQVKQQHSDQVFLRTLLKGCNGIPMAKQAKLGITRERSIILQIHELSSKNTFTYTSILEQLQQSTNADRHTNTLLYTSLALAHRGIIMCGCICHNLNLPPLQDHRDEYAAVGFNVASVKLPTESTTILTTNQIIGIAVGVGLGLILILAVLLT